MQKRTKINTELKCGSTNQSKSVKILHTIYLKILHIKNLKFKLHEVTVQHRVYFLSFINSLKIVLSQFSETYMLLMEYISIRGEEIPNYSKKAIWKLLMHIYIHIVKD